MVTETFVKKRIKYWLQKRNFVLGKTEGRGTPDFVIVYPQEFLIECKGDSERNKYGAVGQVLYYLFTYQKPTFLATSKDMCEKYYSKVFEYFNLPIGLIGIGKKGNIQQYNILADIPIFKEQEVGGKIIMKETKFKPIQIKLNIKEREKLDSILKVKGWNQRGGISRWVKQSIDKEFEELLKQGRIKPL